MRDHARDPIADAHRGPECHVIVVETNDPNMTTQQMADAVLDALHGTDNHDVIHVGVVGRTTRTEDTRQGDSGAQKPAEIHDCYMDSCGASTMPGVACGGCCTCLGSCVVDGPNPDEEPA